VVSRRTEFMSGVKAELPILLGVSPFGLIYGVLALNASCPPRRGPRGDAASSRPTTLFSCEGCPQCGAE
jgi:hypothetical protein